MHHYGGDAPRDHAVTVRHGDGKVFVRGQDRLRNGDPGLRRLRVGFDHRREIRARVAEQIIDPAIGQEREVGGRDISARLLFRSFARLEARSHCDQLPFSRAIYPQGRSSTKPGGGLGRARPRPTRSPLRHAGQALPSQRIMTSRGSTATARASANPSGIKRIVGQIGKVGHETDLHDHRCAGPVPGADAGHSAGQARRQRLGRQLARHGRQHHREAVYRGDRGAG